MKPRLLLLLALSALCATAAGEEGFKGIRCEADIAKALTGRHMPNDRTDAMEARHKDLGLKNLGAEELDWGNQEWWQICGARYALLLDRRDIIRDVLKLPGQAGTAALEGTCKGTQGEVIAVVETKAEAAEFPAKLAWKIDDSKKRYVSVPAHGLLCSRDGLLDGGH